MFAKKKKALSSMHPIVHGNELSAEEAYRVYLALGVKKYSISGKHVIVPILGTDQKKYAVLEESDVVAIVMRKFHSAEGICGRLEDVLDLMENHPIKALQLYEKPSGYSSESLLVKLYKSEKPTEIERASLGRTWINYDAQLAIRSCIFAPPYSFGIWTTQIENLPQLITEICIKRYGSNLMLLHTFIDNGYIVGGKEIVGDEFFVIEHGSIYDKHTWDRVSKILGNESFSETAKRINLQGALPFKL